MAHANALKSPTPFSAIGGGGGNPGGMAGAPSSGILGGAINSLFGPSSFRMNDLRERAAVDRESARSENIGRFRQDVLNAMRQGQSVDQAVMGVIKSNPDVLSDPDFPKTAQDFVELIKPEEATPVVVPAQSRLSTPGGEVLLEAADPAPPANVKIIDEIVKEQQSVEAGTGNKKRLTLLQGLLDRNAANKMNVLDAMRMRSQGIKVPENLAPFPGVNAVTPDQAEGALRAGSDVRADTLFDVIDKAVQGDKNARLSLEVKGAMSQDAMDGMMALFAARDPIFAAAARKRSPQLQDMWDIIDKGEVKAPEGREFEVPIAGRKAQGKAPGADEAKGATTLPGSAAPAVGGTAGTAEGPKLDVQGLTEAFQSLSVKEQEAFLQQLKSKK